MKMMTAFVVLVLAAIGGAVVLKRLRAAAELPVEGMTDSVPLVPVPTMQEAP